jgi:hypothetical protein
MVVNRDRLKQYIKGPETVTLPDGGQNTEESAETARFQQVDRAGLDPKRVQVP